MPTPPEETRAWPWVRFFLEEYLPRHRGSSPQTVQSYRTAFRQLLTFLRHKLGPGPARKVELERLDSGLVLDYLSWLESSEGPGVSAGTRNLRLAALKSFFRCLELYGRPEEKGRWERLRHLPQKRAARPSVDHLELREVDQIFALLDPGQPDGFRDLTLLTVLYNTGARASELAAIRCTDLFLDEPASIRLRGKGRSERRCPLWPVTVSLIRRYCAEFRRSPRASDAAFLFINQRGQRLTRYGIGRRVGHYLALAAEQLPELKRKRLSTHSFRHTTAIHLLEHGAEIHVIKAWLGHRSVRSTDHYLDLNLQSHRDLLARFGPPPSLPSTDTGSDEDDESWLDRL